jgi:DNA polymerase-1
VEAIVDATIPGKIGERIQSSREVALASKQIATIDQFVPLPFSFDTIRYQGMALTNLRSFYQRLEMNSLIRRIPVQSESLESKESLIESESLQILEYSSTDSLSVTQLINKTVFIHLEIQGDNYHTGKIQGLILMVEKFMWYVTSDQLENNPMIRDILENSSIHKVAYDAKLLMNGLHRYSYEVKGIIFDLQLAAYVLEPRLGTEPAEIFSFFDIKIPALSEEILKDYSSHFIAALAQAYGEATKRLQLQPSLHKLYTSIEFPLLFVLATMEQNGIRLDRDFLAAKSSDIQAKIDALEKAIHQEAGEPFNINSPQQVARILFDVLQLPTSKKRSTAAGELDLLVKLHPVVAKILDFRRYTKLQSVYLQGLPAYIHADGKIHTIYNQALTQTGRLSSRDPNLQNITVRDPELKEVRKAFVASQPGWYLISFDYSQIELRVLAHIANASEMIESYRKGIDIHTATAIKVFGVSEEEVTSAMRREAKVVNFGIVYGMSDWGLSEELGINVKEAKAFIKRYFDGFPTVRKYMDDAIAQCEKLGYVSTEFGRIRPVPEIRDQNHNVREFGKRIAMNTPIQGTAADIMKLAMLAVDQALKDSELHAKLLMQVHDELVLEAPLEELMRLIPLVQEAMEHAVSLRVPLKVDYHYGQNWHQ